MPDDQLDRVARKAFNAYAAALDGMDVAGQSIPPWDELGNRVQRGWRVATLVAVDEGRHTTTAELDQDAQRRTAEDGRRST